MSDRETRISDYLDGTMTAFERARFESDVARDPDLAEAVYADLALREALGEATPTVPAAVAAPRKRSWWVGIPLAAAAIVIASIGLREIRSPEAPVMRSPGTTIAAVESPSADRIEWTPITGATMYRVEVLDELGRVTETVLVSDPWVEPAPGGDGWRVVALDNARELARSPMFTLPEATAPGR